LFPIEERSVPRSNVPGELAAGTQPFALTTTALHELEKFPQSSFGISSQDLEFCRGQARVLRNEGVFTPPSLQGTIVWPGFWGGINWDSMSWDPSRQWVVTTVKRIAMVVRLHRHASGDIDEIERLPGGERLAYQGGTYWAARAPFVAPSGMPCTPPPWGVIAAVDLTTGAVRWKRALGTIPALTSVSEAQDWGSLLFGGPIVTAGSIVFVAGTQDDKLRALDVQTGQTLWEHDLPAGGQATPMTYVYGGRQYVVIVAGGRAGIGSRGDWVVAFSLPKRAIPL
jgi:quinoprotein glucose dehydrogenase